MKQRINRAPWGLTGLAAGLTTGLTISLLALGIAAAQPADDRPAVVRDAEAKAQAAQAAAPANPAQPATATGQSQATVADEVAAHDRALAATTQRPTHVKLSFSTRPSSGARVYYGTKLLGTTPFSVQWKHDSGPVDVVVRAPGYLPVNTRAYTFRDDDIAVELTRPADASKLLGYKKKIEAPEDEPLPGPEAVVAPTGEPGPALPRPVPVPAPRSAAP